MAPLKSRRSSTSTVPTKTLKLHAKQEQARVFLAGAPTHNLIYGGSRAGKTFLICRQIAVRAIKAPGSRHIILRQRYNAARMSIWLDTLPAVMRLAFPQVNYKRHEQDGYIQLWNGSEIWIGGLDDKERVDKVLGREFATMFFNECSQIARSSVLVARTRLAQNVAGLRLKAYYDLNPCGDKHWTYREFVEHKSPETGQALNDPSDYQHMVINPRDNVENLPAGYVASLEALPEKQRRRFFDGQYITEIDGALWTMDGLDALRVDPKELPVMKRILVAIDPSGARGKDDVRSDEIGLIAVGLGLDEHGYVLEDASGRFSPEEWASRALHLHQKHGADAIVCERNFGGDMVRSVVESQAQKRGVRGVRLIMVTASRGKAVRAEPVSALYDRGLVHHVGRFPELEDQLTGFSTSGYHGSKSPDRADSCIWGLTELMVTQDNMPNLGLFEAAKECSELAKKSQ